MVPLLWPVHLAHLLISFIKVIKKIAEMETLDELLEREYDNI